VTFFVARRLAKEWSLSCSVAWALKLSCLQQEAEMALLPE
jgi:hypothetical protein